MFDFSKFNVEGFKREIEKHVKEVTEQITVRTYNYILDNEKPVWSGAYVSSWTINAGSIDTWHNVAPPYDPNNPEASMDEYEPPEQITYALAKGLALEPYESVFISNSNPFAYEIETEGTKTSGYTPWKIAFHAANNSIVGYKYF